MKTTTVEIKVDLRTVLEDMKIHRRESIDEVIRRILVTYKYGKSKYDPLLDAFIKRKLKLAEVEVDGRPKTIALGMSRRIVRRGLKLKAFIKCGGCYLEIIDNR